MRLTREHATEAARSLLLAAVFCGLLEIAYAFLIPEVYAAFGSGYRELTAVERTVNWIFALAPAVLLPARHDRPSTLLVLAQYYFIHAPACLLLAHVVRPVLPMADVRWLQIAMTLGMLVLLLGQQLPRLVVRRPRLSPHLFGLLFRVVGLAMFGYLVVVLGRNFRLTNLEDIYDVRAAAVATAAAAPGILYVLGWFASVVLPVTFAVAARRERWLVASAALAGYVFQLGIGGAKTSIMAIVVLPVLHLLTRGPAHRLPRAVPLGLAGLFAAALVLSVTGPELVSLWFTAITIERVFAVPTLLIAQYLEFFAGHDLTYFSHISGIGRLVEYPYLQDLPTTIGIHFYGVPIGSNAGMWAADGLASLGLWGIVFVSTGAAILFWLMDSLAADLDIGITTPALGMIAMTFTNISLATTVVSGGLLLLLGWALIAPSSLRPTVDRPSGAGAVPMRLATGAG
jgi:hypothetical protein